MGFLVISKSPIYNEGFKKYLYQTRKDCINPKALAGSHYYVNYPSSLKFRHAIVQNAFLKVILIYLLK